jgi:hypothetical protein
MTEEKKPQRVYEAVFARTLDECATRLNDAVNSLIEKGYDVQAEPKEMPPGEGFGYMLHCDLKQGPRIVAMPMTKEIMEHLQARMSEDKDSPIAVLGEKSKKLMDALFSKVSGPDWVTFEKELKVIFPSVIHGYSSDDIRKMSEEIGIVLKKHDESHGHAGGECPMHLAMALLISLLQDHLRMSLQ